MQQFYGNLADAIAPRTVCDFVARAGITRKVTTRRNIHCNEEEGLAFLRSVMHIDPEDLISMAVHRGRKITSVAMVIRRGERSA